MAKTTTLTKKHEIKCLKFSFQQNQISEKITKAIFFTINRTL